MREFYGRLLDMALNMRFAIVVAALLIMLAAWPLYMFSQKELAPVEDQSHISLYYEAAPDSSLVATGNRLVTILIKILCLCFELAGISYFVGIMKNIVPGSRRTIEICFPFLSQINMSA